MTAKQLLKQLDGMTIRDAERVLEQALRLVHNTGTVSKHSPALTEEENRDSLGMARIAVFDQKQ